VPRTDHCPERSDEIRRHVQTVAALTLELDLRDDRSAEWALSADDETEPGTPALQTASLVARLLSSGRD
jgi:hypothetical protein